MKIKAISNNWQDSNLLDSGMIYGDIYQVGHDGIKEILANHNESKFYVYYEKGAAVLVSDVNWILLYSDEELKNMENETDK